MEIFSVSFAAFTHKKPKKNRAYNYYVAAFLLYRKLDISFFRHIGYNKVSEKIK